MPEITANTGLTAFDLMEQVNVNSSPIADSPRQISLEFTPAGGPKPRSHSVPGEAKQDTPQIVQVVVSTPRTPNSAEVVASAPPAANEDIAPGPDPLSTKEGPEAPPRKNSHKRSISYTIGKLFPFGRSESTVQSQQEAAKRTLMREHAAQAAVLKAITEDPSDQGEKPATTPLLAKQDSRGSDGHPASVSTESDSVDTVVKVEPAQEESRVDGEEKLLNQDQIESKKSKGSRLFGCFKPQVID